MIAKIVGMSNGRYKERVWSDIEDYIFTNRCDELEDIVFTGDSGKPFSLLELFFTDGTSLSVSFSDRAYIMENNGTTIDLLKYDAKKENRYR